MSSNKLIKISGHYYIRLTNKEAEQLKNNDWDLVISMDKVNLTNKRPITEIYWEKAAKESKRELFMNTVRPILKEKLGFNYSELECERKAKLLCRDYYLAEEKGENYSGPYLLDK